MCSGHYEFVRDIFKKTSIGINNEYFFSTIVLLRLLFHFFREEVKVDFAPSKTAAGGKQAMCMEQYYRVFNTYRKPGLDKDQHISSSGREQRQTENILVLIKSHVSLV